MTHHRLAGWTHESRGGNVFPKAKLMPLPAIQTARNLRRFSFEKMQRKRLEWDRSSWTFSYSSLLRRDDVSTEIFSCFHPSSRSLNRPRTAENIDLFASHNPVTFCRYAFKYRIDVDSGVVLQEIVAVDELHVHHDPSSSIVSYHSWLSIK